MAISEITNTNSVLPTVIQGQTREGREERENREVVFQPAAAPPSNITPAPATDAANQAITPAQEAELLINQTLQGLSFILPTPPGPLGLINETNPLLAALEATQGLDAAQQAELLLNDTLLNLSPIFPLPSNPLLINETNPILATIDATQDLTPAQQAATLVNETLQGVSSAPPVLTPAAVATPILTPATGVVAAPPTPALPATGQVLLPTIPAAVTGAVAPTATVIAATTATTPSPVATAATAVTAATVTRTENLTPTALFTPTVDPTNFGVAVYEIRDQTPAPPEPKPMRRDIFPMLPLGRIRPVDRLVLRRDWERRRESGTQENIRQSTPLAERSILQMVSHANQDLFANGLPLRLVLAKKDKRYLLDIFDCSDDEVCRLKQEIPLDLKELPTILDNIQHESGMIINVMT